MFTNLASKWMSLTLLLVVISGCGGGGGGGSSAPATNNQNTSAVSEGSSDDVSSEDATSNNTNTNTDSAANNSATQQAVIPQPTEIKLLALYTEGVAAQFSAPDLRIQHMVNVANDVLAQSGVDLEFSLDWIEQVNYPDSYPITQALDDLTLANHAAFELVPQLRNDTAADLVVLVRPYANDGRCGYAWMGGYQTNGDFSNPAEGDYGYSVVSSNCSDYTLLHELGHNLGLAHSQRETPDGGTFNYALGHGIDSNFVTIMASPAEFNAVQLPKLSSPELSCNGEPCGVAHTQSGGSDAVRALNISKDQVAAYR